MKFKTVIYKKTPDTYGVFNIEMGIVIPYTGDIPQLYPMGASKESLIAWYAAQGCENVEDIFSEYEMIEVELTKI